MIKMLRCGLLVLCWAVFCVDFSASALCSRNGIATIYYPPSQSCLFVTEMNIDLYHLRRFGGDRQLDEPCRRYRGGMYSNLTSKHATADSEDFIDFLRGFMNYSSIDVVLVHLNNSIPAFSEELTRSKNKYYRRQKYQELYVDNRAILVTPTGWESVYHQYFEIYSGYITCQVEPGLPEPPSCPKDAAVTINTKDSITLHWEPGFTESLNQSFVIKFQACQGVALGRCLPDHVAEIQQNVHFGKMHHTFTLTHPKPLTDYTFTVDAKNPMGTTGNCTGNKVTVTTGDDGFVVNTKPSVAPATARTEILNDSTKDTNVAAIILGVLLGVAVCGSIVLAFLYVKLLRDGLHNKDTQGMLMAELQANPAHITPSPEKTHQEACVKTKSSKKDNTAPKKGSDEKGMKRGQSDQSKGEKRQNVQSKKTTPSTEDIQTNYENLNVAEHVYEKVEALPDNRASQHHYAPFVAT